MIARPRAAVDAGLEDGPELRLRLKRLLVDSLHLEGLAPESIEDDQLLFGEGLGLDSVDALELVVALEREFGIEISSEEVGRDSFASIRALAGLVVALAGERGAPSGGERPPA
jgi:acyl carrier protein